MNKLKKILIFLVGAQMSCNALTIQIIDHNSIANKVTDLSIAYDNYNIVHEHVEENERNFFWEHHLFLLRQGKAALAIVDNEGVQRFSVFYRYDEERNMIKFSLIGYATNLDQAGIKAAMNKIVDRIKQSPNLRKDFCCTRYKNFTKPYDWIIEEFGFVQDDALFKLEDGYSEDDLTWYALKWT